MNLKWMIAAVTVCLMAGCVPSLHPWYADKDVTFEEKLLGVWDQEKDNNLWTFEKGTGESKGYRLTIVSKDKEKEPALLEAHLFKINGKSYLDMFPAGDSLDKANDFFKLHITGLHQLLRIDSIQPTVQFRMLNPDTIGKMIKAKPDLLAHEAPGDGDGVLLTASTEKLQKFIAEHTDEEEFFGGTNDLTRRSPLFAEKDFSFEPKLVGRWIDSDGAVCFCDSVNNQSYRITTIRSKPDNTEVTRYGCAAVSINNRRFLAAYEGRGVTVSGGSDADRTPDLVVWIEQMEPNPQYRVMSYAEAAGIVKMKDEEFKTAVEKLPKVRWIPLVPAEKK